MAVGVWVRACGICEYAPNSWQDTYEQSTQTCRPAQILFLDVLFPLHVHRIIFVDSDQVVRTDLRELFDMDLKVPVAKRKISPDGVPLRIVFITSINLHAYSHAHGWQHYL